MSQNLNAPNSHTHTHPLTLLSQDHSISDPSLRITASQATFAYQIHNVSDLLYLRSRVCHVKIILMFLRDCFIMSIISAVSQVLSVSYLQCLKSTVSNPQCPRTIVSPAPKSSGKQCLNSTVSNLQCLIPTVSQIHSVSNPVRFAMSQAHSVSNPESQATMSQNHSVSGP